jgi:hypothetical protein
VKSPDEVLPAIGEALRIVRDERRSAVIDVWLPRTNG